MNFEERLSAFLSRAETIKGDISGEEATKTSLIMPFFQILGYDVFNPLEFIPEFTADIGIKKGEKVDYAIRIGEDISILIEAKDINQQLEKHDSQLFRYFAVSRAKFAILTNGITYKFFTDLDEPNKMDSSPFLIVNILDMSEGDIAELKKFQKECFDANAIMGTAADLKYMGLIKKVIREEFLNPKDDFVRYILSSDVYDGIKTQAVIEKYRLLIKRAIAQYINDQVNDKIQNALKQDMNTEEPETTAEENVSFADPITTTAEELQAFYIIKSILLNKVPLERISFKDTRSYFSIILDKKVTKWICRLYLKENVKFLIINIDGQDIRHNISSVEGIYEHAKQIVDKTLSLL